MAKTPAFLQQSSCKKKKSPEIFSSLNPISELLKSKDTTSIKHF